MNGMPSDSFSQRAIKPAVLVVLLVLLALGSATKEARAVRDEVDFYNAQFPAAPNCNACEFYVKKLESGGEVSSCVAPAPCALPSFPAAQDAGGTNYTVTPALPITGAHSTNYPYWYYNGDLRVTGPANVTFQGPPTGFLTIYVSGFLCVRTAGGTITINNNVRFVVSGTVATGALCGVANPGIYFQNNTNTVINAGGTAVFMGTNIKTQGSAGTTININCPLGVCGGVAGNPQNLLMISTGNYTEGITATGAINVSGGVFANGTIVTTNTNPIKNTGAFYSAHCPNPPSGITNGGALVFTSASAATNAIQNIDICADPGSP
jgi:hypothetical protein